MTRVMVVMLYVLYNDPNFLQDHRVVQTQLYSDGKCNIILLHLVTCPKIPHNLTNRLALIVLFNNLHHSRVESGRLQHSNTT
jgi:hypothetical protein